MANPILDVQNLTKSFGERVLFRNINFSIAEGQHVGLIAQNGTGKSTLLSMLMGVEGLDSGAIIYRNDVKTGFLVQTPDFNPTKSVLETCLEAQKNPELTRQDENVYTQDSNTDEWTAKQILTQLKIQDLNQPMGQLSGGQQKRVALAAVLMTNPDFIILDEPTNHLDLEMIEWLESYLSRGNKTILMVTHDRFFLDRICSVILELDDETIYSYNGNYSYYLEKRQERIDVMRATIQNANNLYRRELDWMRRQPQARGHKARYREEAFYELEAVAKRRIEERQIRLKSSTVYIGSKIFECQYISKAWERQDGSQLTILKDFYYNFARFEKMGIVGNNGAGKSTFIKMLLGLEQPDSGKFDIGETVKFGYFSQEGMQFREDQKVIDVIREIADYIDLGSGRHMTASQFLQHFLFTPEQQHNYVYKLSGGEKRKLYLCTVLMKNPNFLVLDEPTNDLDIKTLQVLEEYLQDFPGCVIVVSHDRYFTDKVVDHILVFHGDGKVQDFPGNYSQYREWQKLQPKAANDTVKEEKKPSSGRRDGGENKRRMTFKEKREFEQLDKEIELLTKEKEDIESSLSSGNISVDKITEMSKRLPILNDELDTKEMRWLELSELLGSLIMAVFLLTSCAFESNIKKAEKFLALGEYYDAADQFKKAYSKTSTKERTKRGQLAQKMGMCYERINASQKSVAAYKNAVRYGVATLDDRLIMARQMLKTGDYKGALTEFKVLSDSMPNNILVINGLRSAEMAPKWKKEGSHYTIKRQEVFNSRRADYSPCLGGDQYDRLYFSSTRNEADGDELSGITGTKNADIFLSELDDKGKWSKPEPVTGGLNSNQDEGACALTPDGHDMYLTQCVMDGDYPRYAKVMKSTRADAAWGKPTEVAISKDTLSSFAHPAVSPDGNWLYFVSDMPGGQGGMDIWRIRIGSSELGGVENLGPLINTPGNEMFPTFRPNGDLYFSSDGHPGMGGLDIYIATQGKDHRWQIEHPGFPLNSQGDDFGMTFEGQKNQGYFCSNRGDVGRGYDHIYSFFNPEIVQTVKGWVYEQDGYELPKALVYMVGDDGTNLRVSVKGDGSFEQKINPDVKYIFLATCDGFLNHREELSVGEVEKSEEYTLQFPLANIGVPTLINNIFYDFDKATLKPESTAALDKLIETLNENPNITIELSAHCDYRGSDAYNLSLSQRRAEAVCQYLIEHGIPSDRLTPKGYGKSQPKKIRKKLTETYPWLKENDQLSQQFIEKLSKEQQEICNQLNRRTEFIVLRTTYGMFDENGNLKELPKKVKKEQNTSDDGFFIE